jgi:ketol-acid reductoisomerase
MATKTTANSPVRIHLVGYGSQGRAWVEALSSPKWKSLWTLNVYLPAESPSRKLYPDARSIFDLRKHLESERVQRQVVIFLCPDQTIGSLYREFLAPLQQPLSIVLAHGFAVQSGALASAPSEHELNLLAPKVIGPKLAEGIRSGAHSHIAAVHFGPHSRTLLTKIATALGFQADRLIPASFEQETVGDLLSEQGLLCGGVFTLLLWTAKQMREAGVPPTLIKTECITELKLIAELLDELGPAATLEKISPTARAGAALMFETLSNPYTRKQFDARLARVRSGEFFQDLETGAAKRPAETLAAHLRKLESEVLQ